MNSAKTILELVHSDSSIEIGIT